MRNSRGLKRFAQWFAAVLVAASLLGGGVCTAAEIEWEHSLDKALERAKAEKKLIFLDIYADWCQPCQMMLRQTFPAPGVVKALASFVPLKVNSDKDQKTASMYGTGSLPTVAVLTEDGTAIHTQAGFLDVQGMLTFLKTAQDKLKRVQELEKAVADAPDDLGKSLSLLDLYMQMRSGEKAAALAKRIQPLANEKGTAEQKGNVSFNLGFALLLSDVFAEGVKELEAFVKAHPAHARSEGAKDLIQKGKLFDALGRADRGDYAGARELLGFLAENASDSRLAQFAKDRLAAIKSLGQPAPALAVSEWVGGKKGDLAALKGKLVLLVFFQADNSTWTNTARAQVTGLLESNKASGLEAIGIAVPSGSATEESLAAIRTHVKETGIAYPVGIDRGARETFMAYGVEGTPWAVILDRAGNVRHMGFFEKDAVEGKLKGLLMETSG